ncbi:MAG: hypothetical protein LBF38_00905 [Deltaproteobacteria bacterium]|nr:hypothetical protein [Deltaproteobacteria bacterium]
MIIDDELVTRVTDEILKLLKAKASQAGQTGPGPVTAPVTDPGAKSRPTLMVVGPLDALSEKGQGVLAENFSIMPIRGLDQSGRPKAPLLITSLGLQALVQVASGDEGCTEEGRALLSNLLEGRSVAALESGVAWRKLGPLAPRVLVSLYRSAEATLVSAGLKIVPESGLIRALCAQGTLGGGVAKGYPGGQGSRVLTESVVKNLFPDGAVGPLELRPGDILTPLGRDYLASKKIDIVK